jgi:hypothetical protein
MKQPINRVDPQEVATFVSGIAGHHLNALDVYQKLATRSAIYPGQGTPFGLMYAALGLAEAGEVQNKVKKAFRDDDCITIGTDRGDGSHDVTFQPISPERRQQIVKELGGALWYIAATCNEIGSSMSEVAAANLIELADRSERGTLGGSGDNR